MNTEVSEPKSYKIEHVTDLLQVPKDRRARCMAELLATIEQADGAAKLLNQEFPNVPPMEVEAFTWIDDGETNLDLNVFGETIWSGKI